MSAEAMSMGASVGGSIATGGGGVGQLEGSATSIIGLAGSLSTESAMPAIGSTIDFAGGSASPFGISNSNAMANFAATPDFSVSKISSAQDLLADASTISAPDFAPPDLPSATDLDGIFDTINADFAQSVTSVEIADDAPAIDFEENNGINTALEAFLAESKPEVPEMEISEDVSTMLETYAATYPAQELGDEIEMEVQAQLQPTGEQVADMQQALQVQKLMEAVGWENASENVMQTLHSTLERKGMSTIETTVPESQAATIGVVQTETQTATETETETETQAQTQSEVVKQEDVAVEQKQKEKDQNVPKKKLVYEFDPEAAAKRKITAMNIVAELEKEATVPITGKAIADRLPTPQPDEIKSEPLKKKGISDGSAEGFHDGMAEVSEITSMQMAEDVIDYELEKNRPVRQREKVTTKSVTKKEVEKVFDAKEVIIFPKAA